MLHYNLTRRARQNRTAEPNMWTMETEAVSLFQFREKSDPFIQYFNIFYSRFFYFCGLFHVWMKNKTVEKSGFFCNTLWVHAFLTSISASPSSPSQCFYSLLNAMKYHSESFRLECMSEWWFESASLRELFTNNRKS